MPSYFGLPRGAQGFQEMQRAEYRRGLSCTYCSDPIHADQDGVIDDDQSTWHAECWLLQKLRLLSPSAGTPAGGQSRRDAAVIAVSEFERHATLGARTPEELKADADRRERAAAAREQTRAS